MEKLTKENFWDALYAKYPGQVQVFCEWIDAYKKKVEWNILFGTVSWSARYNVPATDADWKTHKRDEIIIHQFKFHDIPIAMQWGIFQQFCAEQHPSGFGGIESSFEHPADMDKIPGLIMEYFAEMQSNDDTEHTQAKYEADYNEELM